MDPIRKPHYKVTLSTNFLIVSVLSSCFFALCIGRLARIYLLSQGEETIVYRNVKDPLPSLIVNNGENIPFSRYSSKNFDTSMSTSSSSWLAVSRDESATDATLLISQDDSIDKHQEPSAEHLMVDIKHVESAFLNSEGRLANAIVQVMNEANLTLLSYHCHGLTPMGVSCVGVLKQNYISLHTWPEEGVITLDLCAGNAKSLLPVLPILKRAFGIPRSSGLKPELQWTHKVRGYPSQKTVTPKRRVWHISSSGKGKDLFVR